MAKTLLFLGSSTAAKSQARAIAASLTTDSVEFLPWWDAFPAGRTLLEQLDSIRSKVNGAVLIFSPEAEGTVRGNAVQMPNLNVLFEFGYFYGHFGRERVALMKYGDFYLPTDFGGYIHIAGSRFFRRGAVVKVGKRTKSEFSRWLGAAGFQPSQAAQEAASAEAEAEAKKKAKQANALRYRAARGLPTPGSWMG